MGHCVGWMELQRFCTLVFISIMYFTNDNYYCYNEHYMLLMYQFIIMLSHIYNHFTFGPIEETVATIGPFCNFIELIFFKIRQ